MVEKEEVGVDMDVIKEIFINSLIIPFKYPHNIF